MFSGIYNLTLSSKDTAHIIENQFFKTTPPMNNCMAWSRQLDILLENNFMVINLYKLKREQEEEGQLTSFFEKQISRRNHFIAELKSEIKFLGYSPSLFAFRSRSKNYGRGDRIIMLDRCIYTEQTSLMEYKKALSLINNGHSREILIRHKSFLESTLKELKNLKSKLNFLDNGRNELRKIN